MVFTPNANGPRGFDVAKGRDGTPGRSRTVNIAGTYATKLYVGQPVTIDTNGQAIALSAANTPVAGIFDGCEYVDVNGDIRFSPYWPAPGAVKAGTKVKARIYEATEQLFLIHSDEALTQAAVGQFFAATVAAATGGDDVTGRSSAQLDGSTGTTALGAGDMVQVLEVSPREEGGEGAPGSLAVVQFARPQFAANVA